MSDHTIRIEGGEAAFVYSDELVDLLALGESRTTRASHVEPHPSRAGWVADMRPSGGPVLGKAGEWQPQSTLPLEYIGDLERQFVGMLDPFPTREEALAAEREWLRAHRGL
jgi:hypothetical protein